MWAVAAAALGAVAFPPLDLWPLSLVSVTVFVWLLRDKNGLDARNIGLVYGLAYAGGTMYWMFGIFGVFAIPLLALMAAYSGILATLIAAIRSYKPLARASLIALFAVAIEWLRGDAWYLRFPWYTPPHALASAPVWIAPVHWVGAYGLSYVIWFIAGCTVLVRWWSALAFACFPLCAYLLPPLGETDREALLIQAEDTLKLEAIVAQIPDGKADIAVLPEYAYYSSPKLALASRRGPATLARRLHCPVVFGAVEGGYGEPGYENVAAVIDADGNLLGKFTKQRPVPLFLDGLPGTSRPVFPTADGTLGVAICYDFDAPAVAAALVRQGASVFVLPTLDAMSWGRIQHIHHELLLRLRAVENDRWILRAASSGRTEAVSPRGVPSEEAVNIGEDGFTTVAFNHRSGVSLGGQLFVLGPAAAAGTALFVILQLAGWWKQRKDNMKTTAKKEQSQLIGDEANR